MTAQPTTPKRWRPRFSVRTLVILVTLVCCYAACWGPTKDQGVDDVINVRLLMNDVINARLLMHDLGGSDHDTAIAYFDQAFDLNQDASAMMPLLVRTDQILVRNYDTNSGLTYGMSGTRHYYFWFFGYVAKLPYERDW